MATKSLASSVKAIAKDAKSLVELIQPLAAEDKTLSAADLKKVKKLVEDSDAALTAANEAAKEQRQEEIKRLEESIKNFDLALSTPGLDQSVRDDIKDLRRRRLSKLHRLQAKEAVDFAGILTSREINEIGEVLKEAKRDVARKKKAASLMGTVVKIADLALGIAAKLI